MLQHLFKFRKKSLICDLPFSFLLFSLFVDSGRNRCRGTDPSPPHGGFQGRDHGRVKTQKTLCVFHFQLDPHRYRIRRIFATEEERRGVLSHAEVMLRERPKRGTLPPAQEVPTTSCVM